MTLANRLGEIQNIVHNTKCTYILLLESMKSEDREALEDAWAKGYSQRVILRALRSEGYKTSNESIANHRTGNCKCPKS
jgi:hypothetical protein